MEITSVKNDKIAYLLSLKKASFQKAEKLYLIEGEHLVEEAIKHNYLKTLIILDKYQDKYDFEDKIIISDNVLRKLSDLNTPSYVLGVCHFNQEKELIGNLIVLDRIQNPNNLGALIRSAKAFGFNNFFITDDSCSYYNHKVLRATQGNHFDINLLMGDLFEFLNRIKDRYSIVTTFLDLKNDEIKTKKDICLILGNEGSGINKKIKDYSDFNVKINTSLKVESLNIVVSGSIIMEKIYNNK